MTKLSNPTQKYLAKMVSFSQLATRDDSLPKIHVDYIASRIAFAYEKLRQVIDYQGEHLLRKNAIERILTRRLMLSTNPKEIASPLIFELIRGGYFPNDQIPENKIQKVQDLLEKYIFILKSSSSKVSRKRRNKVFRWIKELAACEIEEIMSPPLEELALLEYMNKIIKLRLKIENNLTEQEKEIQIMIACQKSLLKSDEILISYRLFKYHLRNWPNLSDKQLSDLSQNIFSLREQIEGEMNNPFGIKIFKTVSRHTAPFLVIGDVVSSNPTESLSLFNNPEALEKQLLKAYNKRLKECKAKTRRSGTRSVLSMLFSKATLAFLIEVPVDIYLTKTFYWPNLAINIVFPPFLMFFIVSSIKLPKEENALKIVMEAIKVIKWSENPDIINVKTKEKTGKALKAFFSLIFFIFSVATFAALVYLLLKINFSILSIVIFFVFFCLIAFSGMKTSVFAKELNMQEKEDGLGSFLLDLFFTPFVQAGKFLSEELKKHNFFILLLNLFFEAPLQTFFEFLETWRGYLKEKREETE